MRHSATLLMLPLFVLAACGGGAANNAAGASYDLPNGAFDRARFRAETLGFCRTQLQSRSDLAGRAGVICECAAGRMLAADDAALRALVADERLAVRRNSEAIAQCTASAGNPYDVEELPPPDEPLPSMSDATPPPMIAPPADGAAPGGGTIPSGGRARARANLSSYFSSADYPAAALRGNEQGRVFFTLDVSPEGRVANCLITQSSGSAALDSTTCRIMRSRARFEPARDARGRAVGDRTTASVLWRLPS